MADPKRKLPLVEPGTELSGRFPRGFEQAVRGSQVGDARHRAVLFAIVTLAWRGMTECVPPGARSPWLFGLERVREFALGTAKLAEVKECRSQLFERAHEPVAATVAAITRVLDSQADAQALDTHAGHVVRRYVSLSAHLAASAVIECLDAVLDPLRALEVSKNAAAAIAYRSVGLGAARQQTLRATATEQAEYEQRTVLQDRDHDATGLALQLFHEYLGVHWKNHVDAQRVYLEQFLEWVFPEATMGRR